MIVYFAGTTMISERETFLFKVGAKRLYSYHWHGPEGFAQQDYLLRKKLIDIENKIPRKRLKKRDE